MNKVIIEPWEVITIYSVGLNFLCHSHPDMTRLIQKLLYEDTYTYTHRHTRRVHAIMHQRTDAYTQTQANRYHMLLPTYRMWRVD
jgi:hypothetical protein